MWSLGNQTIGSGTMSSGANRVLDISFAWSVKGSEGKTGEVAHLGG